MKNILFNNRVLEVESKIMSELKIPSLLLMENAGKNCADFLLKEFKDQLSSGVTIIAGKGNNAGDGFVIARHLLNQNIRIKLILLYSEHELINDSLTNFEVLKSSNNNLLTIVNLDEVNNLEKEIKENKIIIDAIFGVGFKGKMDEKIEKVIEQINKTDDKLVIAIDIPSGLSFYNQNEISIKADYTLTMGTQKFHSLFYNGKQVCGKVEVMNIGISEDEFLKYNIENIFQIDVTDIKKVIPKREKVSHKYQNGKVFILAGSKGMTGAAYMCSQSALRMGSGAVILGYPESLDDIMEIKLTEVIKLPLEETKEITLSEKSYGKIIDKIEWSDATLIGPGISLNEETKNLVLKIIKNFDQSFVLDADALGAIKNNLDVLRNKKNKIILTPHMGEFARLIDVELDNVKNNFYEYSKKFAKEYNVILVLKNSPTIITDGDYFYINSTGKENLASVGTGDVLAGIIASLYSQIGNALTSSVAGVFIHGMCGDELYEISGSSSTIATDLIKQIPKVKSKLLEE